MSTSKTVDMKFYRRLILISVTNATYLIDMGLLILKNILELCFRNSVEFERVLAATLKINVCSECHNSFGEHISEFTLPEIGGTCGINKDIY
jgi:hypothetical protein